MPRLLKKRRVVEDSEKEEMKGREEEKEEDDEGDGVLAPKKAKVAELVHCCLCYVYTILPLLQLENSPEGRKEKHSIVINGPLLTFMHPPAFLSIYNFLNFVYTKMMIS